jgi:hypothetical protein
VGVVVVVEVVVVVVGVGVIFVAFYQCSRIFEAVYIGNMSSAASIQTQKGVIQM